jgi:hypothetical protein
MGMMSRLAGVLLALSCLLSAQNAPRSGIITGTVHDLESMLPIPGALIEVKTQKLQALTDERGRFTLLCPPGLHRLECSAINYETVIKGNLAVRPGRTLMVHFALPLHLRDQVTVSSGSFPSARQHEVSRSQLNNEELRRAPGSAGDISRVLGILPSVTRVSDMLNALAVRGGSPSENAFFVDKIPVPDINHYPTPGSTGGPIGMLNVDFIDDVTLYAGGFPIQYGNRLSSVMDISLREGNRHKTQVKGTLDLTGFGFIGEGPLAKKNGSWLLSLRRSTIDLALKLIGEESGIAPRYSDVLGKISLDLSPRHRLTLLGIAGIDWVGWEKSRAEGIGNSFYGDNQGHQLTLGLNWRWIWKNGSSDTSLSTSQSAGLADYRRVSDETPFMKNDSSDFSLSFRNHNSWIITPRLQLQWGLEFSVNQNNFEYFLRAYTDFWGRINPPQTFDDICRRTETGLFTALTYSPGPFTLVIGLRGEHNSLNQQISASPRLSISFKPSTGTTLTAATGWYRQHLPLLLLNQCPLARPLPSMQAGHLILGLSQMLGTDLRLTLETYYKTYDHLPVDPDQPLYFFIDELVYGGAYLPKADLVTTGKARAYGLEFTLQKKLASHFFGMISGSIFRSRYRDGLGQWRDRIFDVHHILGVEGGYRPGRNWAFGLRWTYSGGSPYTPFDMAVSVPLNAGIYDQTAINTRRNPPIHALNLRIDRHFFFKSSSLTLFLDIWNLYNRRNSGLRYWNNTARQEDTMSSWGILPILGLEYEL